MEWIATQAPQEQELEQEPEQELEQGWLYINDCVDKVETKQIKLMYYLKVGYIGIETT